MEIIRRTDKLRQLGSGDEISCWAGGPSMGRCGQPGAVDPAAEAAAIALELSRSLEVNSRSVFARGVPGITIDTFTSEAAVTALMG